MRFAIAAALCLSLAGCAAMQVRPVTRTLSSAYDPAEVAWSKAKGTASIAGQAFFQTRGGQPRTCAGTKVTLLPDSAHLRERLTAIYGAAQGGFNPASGPQIVFVPDNEVALAEARREAVCDAQGNFTFADLPAGAYYVVSRIVWTIPGSYAPPEGGSLMRRVELGAGQAERVILTP